jgi:hypothetical protein
MSSALDHSTTSTPYIYCGSFCDIRFDFGTVTAYSIFFFIIFFKSTFALCYLQNKIINLQKLLSHIYSQLLPHCCWIYDQTTPNYKFWYPGMPQSASSAQSKPRNCGMMLYNHSGKWYDQQCGNSWLYICESNFCKFIILFCR